MSDAPEKEALELLSKHPVEEILTVEGESRSIIESPEFIKMHLAHSMKKPSHHSLILSSEAECLYLLSAEYDTVIRTNFALFKELQYPLMTELPSSFLGSCNGLICLLHPQDVMVLWNPSTNKFKKLPVEFPSRKTPYAFYGFGYDSVNDDYKVVRILQFSRTVNDKEIHVYSLKSNSWKLLVLDFPYFVKFGNAMLANGAVHWVVKENSASEGDTGKRVIAFDLGTEEFGLVTLPVFSDDKFYLNLGVMDGCLSVVCNYEMDGHAEIWVRKKQPGTENVWTNLITIRQSDVVDGFLLLRPIAYSKAGKRVLLLRDDSQLLWYHLVHKSTIYAIMQTSSGAKFQCVCVNSLVQPNSEQNLEKELKSDDFPQRDSS